MGEMFLVLFPQESNCKGGFKIYTELLQENDYICLLRMRWIDNIKEYFGRRKLQHLVLTERNRTKQFVNLNQAKSVGLIYTVGNEQELKQIQNFANYLKGEFGIKTVYSLVYVDKKEVPPFVQAKHSFDFFLSSDLSWRKEPIKDVCKNFQDINFDILIDLTDEFSLPLRFILVQTKAKFKVGRFSEANQPFYDFMITCKEKGNFKSFTKEVVRYLTIINA